MRYVVTELEGFLTKTGDGPIPTTSHPGLSCHVIDALVNHRLVASYRTEYGTCHNRTPRVEKMEAVRSAAHEHAERLNAAHLREAVSPHSETAA